MLTPTPDNYKLTREALGLRQDALARALGISRATVYHREAGRKGYTVLRRHMLELEGLRQEMAREQESEAVD